MESPYLYQQIIQSIRNDIFSGVLKPGSHLPTVREMAKERQCTIGTIMRAYQELARQGLVISRVGKGTSVADNLTAQDQTPLRRASLYNRVDAFLLEIMTAGYTTEEVEQSFRANLDRWRAVVSMPAETSPNILRFVGSHDPSLSLIADHFHEANPELVLHLSFTGSLGGLIALAEKSADLAGCHLWDELTDTYNEPFVRKLLPGQKVALLTLAHRRIGLIVAPGNPLGVNSINDIARPGIRFLNRQQGSGTRVWLDVQLHRAGLDSSDISGYQSEKMTHSEVARAISKGDADVGLGVETAALSFGLGFKFLTIERYDLVIPGDKWELGSIQALKRWLDTPQAKVIIAGLGGCDMRETGTVTWIS
jgi:molybdate-binding protein/DNA-binding transcriptional regulator YhcF (GntR family)